MPNRILSRRASATLTATLVAAGVITPVAATTTFAPDAAAAGACVGEATALDVPKSLTYSLSRGADNSFAHLVVQVPPEAVSGDKFTLTASDAYVWAVSATQVVDGGTKVADVSLSDDRKTLTLTWSDYLASRQDVRVELAARLLFEPTTLETRSNAGTVTACSGASASTTYSIVSAASSGTWSPQKVTFDGGLRTMSVTSNPRHVSTTSTPTTSVAPPVSKGLVYTTQGRRVDAMSMVNTTQPGVVTYAWVNEPDWDAPGRQSGTVHVTYPGGQTFDVPSTVEVIATPVAVTPAPSVTQGEHLLAADTVRGADGAQLFWEHEPDWSAPGTQSGTVRVTYPSLTLWDGQPAVFTVPVQVNVIQQAAPTAVDGVTTGVDTPLEASTAVTNTAPDATVTWSRTPDWSTPGSQSGTVKVSWGGDEQYVPVTVTVRAGAPAPVTGLTTEQGSALPASSAVTGVRKGGSVTWASEPDWTRPGQAGGRVRVTYPGGESYDVPVTVAVTQVPVAGPRVSVGQGQTVDPRRTVTNHPADATVTWNQAPDTSRPGTPRATVTVAFGGRSYDVPVTLTVIAAPTPKADLVTGQGSALDAATTVGGVGDAGRVSWASEPDWSAPGSQAGTVRVTYPGGVTFDVPVTVKVVAAPTPVGDLTTGQGQGLHPQDGVKGAPGGSEYTWATEPDWDKPGTSQGTVRVTTPDGVVFDVTVPVTVEVAPTPATSTASPVVTGQDQPVDASRAVASLPEGAQAAWVTTPDWSTPGDTTGAVKVTYTSGTSFTVDTYVRIEAAPTAREGLVTGAGQALDATSVLDAVADGATVTWAAAPDWATPAPAATGTAHVANPSGVTFDVPVTVRVEAAPTAREGLATGAGQALQAADAVAGAPEGSTLTWGSEPDWARASDAATGTVHVVYPSGVAFDAPVTVRVVAAPTAAPVTTGAGQPVDASRAVAGTPDGSTTTWKSEPDWDKVGSQSGTVTVTTPDKVTFDVTVPVTVEAAPTPATTTVYTGQGQKVDASRAVAGAPDGSTTTWVSEPDWDKVGTAEGTAHVVYPSGVTFDVPTTVTVIAAPTAREGLVTGQGQPLEAASTLTGAAQAATVTWAAEPAWATPGAVKGTAHVTDPTGVTFDVPVTVTVQAAPTWAGTTSRPLVTGQGQKVDASASVTDLPDGARAVWTVEPDVSAPGTATGTVTVTYTSGVSFTHDVTVTVVAAPTARGDLSTGQGEAVTAASAVDSPAGGTATWATEPAWNKPGEQSGTVHVTTPAGPQFDVDVTVTVVGRPAAATDLMVDQGQDLDPLGAVTGTSEGARATWATAPDTTLPGVVDATVTVTYPTGQTYQVPVKVTVVGQPVPVDGLQARQGEPVPATSTVTNTARGATVTWKVEPDWDKPGTTTGVVAVTGDGVDYYTTVTVTVVGKPAARPLVVGQHQHADADQAVTGTPDGTKHTWKTQPDWDKVGEQEAVVTSTYPNGMVFDTTVTLTVVAEPVPSPETVYTGQGVAVDPSKTVAGAPDESTYTWDKEPDWNTPGQQAGTVKITTPDGVVFTVDTTVTVVAAPTLTDGPAATAVGRSIDPSTLLDGTSEGAQVTWGTEPDWTRPGQTGGVIHVADPTGVTFDLPVTVTVHATPTPVADLTTSQGKAVDATDAVTGTPDGSVITWKVEPDWDKAGTTTGVIHVETSDGVTFDIPVTVTITPAPTSGEGKQDGGLAKTGAAVGGLLATAGALIGSGLAVLRRRRD